MPMYKILLLEDNVTDIDLVSREIKGQWSGVDLTVVSRVKEAKKLLLDSAFDIALFDLKLPDGNGMDLLGELRAEKCDLPIIILTATGSEELAIAALKSGANDYVSKKAGYHKNIPQHIEFTLKHIQENRQDLSVLYVEHHKSDVDLTLRHLKKHAPHIHLTQVSTGEEALNRLPENNNSPCTFDVLMLDYRLPGLNALEISKQIRQERNLSIAIVIATGQGDEDIAVEALKIGVDDYIIKHDNYLLHLPSVLTSAYRRREMERQQLELKQSELKFRLLADYAADWEYWICPEGNYIYISPVCEDISGYSPGDFQENKNLLAEITRPDYREEVHNHFVHDAEGLHKPMEFPIITAEGKEKWISHFCQAVYDEKGNYLGKRGVNRDITERKQADLELRQSEERFKRLFEDLGDAVYVTQIGDKMGDILEVNSAAIKQSGYSREELLKMNIIDDLSIPNSGTEVSSEDSDRQLLSGGTVTYIEKKRRKNGEEYWTEIIITPVEFNGGKAGLSINRDITDRKIQEEKLLIALDAAKESDRIKTAFLANMSHELRTPLNAVIGFSDLIDADTSTEDNLEFAEHINKSGLNLLEIVDGIFEVTLIERGQVNVNKSQKSVTIFLNDIYQTILHRKKNRGSSEVTVEQELKEIDIDTVAFTDFNILKQILMGLLGNALKFTHKGFIRFGVSPSENENELVFYVKDTGIGISKEKHESIFERFKIGDDTRTRKYSGVGVGLYISSKLIDLLGGKIWLESELGKGSTFYFSIKKQ